MTGLIVTLVAIGIILIVLIIILVICIITKDWFNTIHGSIFVIACSVAEILIILELKNVQPEPTAIDVYRGLTELEITSVNGVSQDTIVVFKNR